MASFDVLSVNFDNNNIPGEFRAYQEGNATITANQKKVTVNLPSSATSATLAGIDTQITYDLTSSRAYIQTLVVPSSSTSANAEFKVEKDDNNWLRFVYEAGVIYIQKYVAGVKTTLTSFTYSATEHSWWRIRESGGTTYFDTSKDGVAWVLQYSVANPITVTAMTGTVSAYCYQNETNPGQFVFDNFNYTPPPPTTILSPLNSQIRRKPQPKTVVEILDRDLDKIAEIKNLYPLNKNGDVLRYTKELSDYGICTFRISTNDPVFEEFGDIIEPHKYHVRIRRGGVVVWQGAIVDNPSRQAKYQEVEAFEYLYYLDKVLVKRTSEAATGAGYHYRKYTSGTMSSNIITTLTEAVAAFGTSHIMADLTFPSGGIENPNYPLGFTNVSTGLALTGAWNFSDSVSLQFDYHSVLFVLKAFGAYSKSDFKIDNDLVFTFKTFLGNKQPNLTFTHGINGLMGNIVDYDIPRYGRRMANDLYGIAAGELGQVYFVNKRDEASINEYGLLQSPIAFTDVKGINVLKVRVDEELRFVKDPENSPINLKLSEKAYPLGQYDIGDIVSVVIKDNVIDYNAPRRIVRISVAVHNTGRELTTITTNPPRESDLGL